MKKLLLATTLCAAFGAAHAVPTLAYDPKAGAGYDPSGIGATFSRSALNAAVSGNHFDPTTVYSGNTGGSLKLSEAPASLTFTYLGTEAGHTNTFEFKDGRFINVFNNTTSSAFTSFFDVEIDNANRLNLTFNDQTTSFTAKSGYAKTPSPCSGGTISACNPNNQSFGFLNLGTYGAAYESFNGDFDYLLLFNDDWNDTDYNDMVVGIKVSPIPEPETYALMMAGLGVVGFMARRRRKV